MNGRTHAASGAVAALAVTALCGLPPVAAPVMAVVSRLSAYAPDLDHPAATATRALPPVSWVACWALRNASVRLGMPAHRGLTHTWVFAVAWGVLAGAVAAWWLVPLAAFWTGVFAAVGCFTGMLGDVPTRTGLRFLWWPSRRRVYVPEWLRFRTGGRVENVVFGVLVAVGCLLLSAVAK